MSYCESTAHVEPSEFRYFLQRSLSLLNVSVVCHVNPHVFQGLQEALSGLVHNLQHLQWPGNEDVKGSSTYQSIKHTRNTKTTSNQYGIASNTSGYMYDQKIPQLIDKHIASRGFTT